MGSDKGSINKRGYLLSAYCVHITDLIQNDLQGKVDLLYFILIEVQSHNIQVSILKCTIQLYLLYSNAGQPPLVFSYKTFSLSQENST